MEEKWAEMVEFPASHVGVPEGVANGKREESGDEAPSSWQVEEVK